MQRNICILMHTHWDREWYFTKDETKVLLSNHMKEVIEFLEENEDIIYILDGQSVMIDDFLQISPKWEKRLKKLSKKGQLRIGPWYTQTDLLIVHGESIIRNLFYGIKLAEKYGDPMKIGYAPDTFGHSSQMPQIYRLFGIKSTFFWRGFSELKSKKSDFIWEGVDGSRIYGVNLSTGYQGAKYLESDKKELEARMKKIMKVLDNYSVGEMRLVMNGHDQMPIQKNIHEIIDKLKEIYPDDIIRIGDFESYVENIKGYKMDVVSGELTHSKHSRIHKTINSTRMDIKLLNSELEGKFYNILEPLAILGSYINLDYPHEMLEYCYKEMFGTHAHDSIGGCNSDKVNRDIRQRLLSVKEIADTQIELYMRLITLASKDSSITVYNFLPYRRKNEWVEIEILTKTKNFFIKDDNKKNVEFIILNQEITDAGLIDRQIAARLMDIKVYRSKILMKVERIEGLSVKYYSHLEIENIKECNIDITKDTEDTENCIENEFYKITVNNRNITLYDKINNRNMENFFFIENSGNAGDSYDYSPPHKDMIINEPEKIYDIEKIKLSGDIGYESMVFKVEYTLPLNIMEREKGIVSQKVFFNVKISLNKGERLIRINMDHKNKIFDSRYRIGFKTGLQNEYVESDSHLCVVKKPVYFEKELSVWEEEKWAEKPVSIETFQSYAALEENNVKSGVISEGLKEYEVMEDTIYITLFRSFSHLGKKNLINRPGRPSGIEVLTPDNQLIDEEFKFRFGFIITEDNDNISEISKKFLTPLKGYQLKEFNRFNINIPRKKGKIEKSLNIDLQGCVVSSLKMNDENSIFIRLFNPEKEIKDLKFERDVYLSTVFEKKGEKISTYKIKPQEILNIIIK